MQDKEPEILKFLRADGSQPVTLEDIAQMIGLDANKTLEICRLRNAI